MTRTLTSIFGVLLAACGSTDSRAPLSSDAGAAKEPAPANLRQFESGAEAMSEAPRGTLPAHVPNWTMAAAALEANLALWPDVKAAVTAAGASASTVGAIDAALTAYRADVTGQRQRDAETDANKITTAVPDLFDLFSYSAPTDSLRLDGTFRQLQIESEFQDWLEAQTALDDTKVVWNRMKPLVAAQAPKRPDLPGSATVVADTDGAIVRAQNLISATQHAPADAAGLGHEAQTGLDLVDVCEQIFK